MYYEKTNSEIRVYSTEEFSAKHILDCGQVFRYRNNGDCHTVYSRNKICLLQTLNDCVIIKADDTDYFARYFDLERDYSEIKSKLSRYDGMNEALLCGKGIRILNQDPYETIISFIISANNNIPRIKGIIERICLGIGEEKNGYHAFPTPERMASADEDFFKSIGAGYRAPYLVKTAKRLRDFDFEKVKKSDTETGRELLTNLMGVGNKVADCILLFAFQKTDIFPMDTWSKKIYAKLGFPEENNPKKMAERLVDRFGNLSGYAQQYLYYYYREKK